MASPTFFQVEWDQLEPVELENLCLELLAQMGFQGIEWWKESPDLDLVAELPKRDPDGFDYRELWLINIGRRGSPLVILDGLASITGGYRLNSWLRRLTRGRKAYSKQVSQSITTVLFITLRVDEDRHINEVLKRYEERGISGKYEIPFRVRVWNRLAMTLLVQRFPQIGYKYFTEAARARSKYRKTPEQLYKENAALSAELIAERDLRIRAERDAAWKDISFSAAHKIGNPIFAIETNLEPLRKRLRESLKEEALEVVEGIATSVEKAKAIVDQFKSLTRAQTISPAAVPLLPILEDACRTVQNTDVDCWIDCPEDLVVYGDPERLSECFDELVANAKFWLDRHDDDERQPEKKIAIRAAVVSAGEQPESLDSTSSYARIRVVDTGPGVTHVEKTRIFEPFVTTHSQGTGLGLAFVRTSIEGHGGAIREIGSPGSGAELEIYLPLAIVDSEDESAESASPEEHEEGVE